MRLNKYLARYAGVSRREADRMIEAGRVIVDGKTAVLGQIIDDETSKVYIGDKLIVPDVIRHYYAVYKPEGYISSTVRQDKEDLLVTDLAPEQSRIRLFPMGRLDKDSEGLIILTDDGELMDKVLRSRYGHEKEYRVKLDRPVTGDIINEIEAGGLDIGESRRTKSCAVELISPDELIITLTEGMNREIRRIFEKYGIRVKKLCRTRFMNITLDGLRPGDCRELTETETGQMKAKTLNSRHGVSDDG